MKFLFYFYLLSFRYIFVLHNKPFFTKKYPTPLILIGFCMSNFIISIGTVASHIQLSPDRIMSNVQCETPFSQYNSHKY